MNIIQALDGFTIAVGMQVKFYSNRGSSGVGIVRAIEMNGERIMIDPDWRTVEFGDRDYWMLNAEAAKAAGKPDFFGPRDHGVSLGSIRATRYPMPPYAKEQPWAERDKGEQP